ncbi:type II secretion system minor pseudopilin GspK [Ectothiorhodospira lacustris]|uniref:type II secretion system minor pseudopilin GspK n=1 Tax=Ectothiorhodospira lacustris TaxID=2899127 RepID=UPI001EE91A44|nr:type II secretion system minor pseudopilin GspK [Ectothiorhodospira lacustris]MCG5509041.1 type II secretion system minor pseudopilin GspK [Ectothiorhodospira lacustris]MCG5520832.1 type II secretion system minor pseudopilin GspK [Ectothiorhodospira lacustris]
MTAAMYRRQQGVALITALLVVALATIAAVSMATRQHLDIRRTTNVFTHDQAYQLSLGAEAYALRLLGERGEDDELPWEGCVSPAIPVYLEEAELVVLLEDLHCRFNLNALAREDDELRQGFVRLLEEIARETPDLRLDPERLLVHLTDWLDPETDDPAYRALDPPYLSGNRPMLSPSELRLVLGVTTPIWWAVVPYVTALPETTSIMNLQVAPEVLQRAFGTAEDTTVESRYFRLAVRTELAGRRFLLCSVLDTREQRVVLREQTACGP